MMGFSVERNLAQASGPWRRAVETLSLEEWASYSVRALNERSRDVLAVFRCVAIAVMCRVLVLPIEFVYHDVEYNAIRFVLLEP